MLKKGQRCLCAVGAIEDPKTVCVVGYKGGTLEKKLLIQLQIPYVNLEDFGCPKFEYLPEYYFSPVHCGCHLNSRFHCSMAECHAFMRWFNINTQQ